MLYLGNQIGGSDVDEVASGKRQQKRHIKCEGDINNTISDNRLRRLKPSQPVVRPIGNVIDAQTGSKIFIFLFCGSRKLSPACLNDIS